VSEQPSQPSQPVFPTSLGTSDADHIGLLGADLAHDLMGKVGFAELAYWLVALRRPTPGELRVFEAVLVALADHGFTPTAIAARVTLLSAPDSLQGALAAGLLGGGSRFLGVTEDSGQFLARAIAGVDGDLPVTEAGWDELALAAIAEQRAAGKYVPGLGHPVHKVQDPRTPVLMAIAQEPWSTVFARTSGMTNGQKLRSTSTSSSGTRLPWNVAICRSTGYWSRPNRISSCRRYWEIKSSCNRCFST